MVKIKYYTADVNNRPPNNQGDRQKIYLKALNTLSKVEIIKGHFLGPKAVKMPECDVDGNYLNRSVYVLKTEEKGSDVNLAVDLLHDCIKDEYDCAVIISNDSDLISPIKITRNEYKKVIGWVNPQIQQSSLYRANIDFSRPINEKILSNSQLPEEIIFDSKIIRKPSQWY